MSKTKLPLLDFVLKQGETDIESLAMLYKVPKSKKESIEVALLLHYQEKGLIEIVNKPIALSNETGLVAIHQNIYIVKNKKQEEFTIDAGVTLSFNGVMQKDRKFGKQAKQDIIDNIQGHEAFEWIDPASFQFDALAEFMAIGLYNIFTFNTNPDKIQAEIIHQMRVKNIPSQRSQTQNVIERMEFCFKVFKAFNAYHLSVKEKPAEYKKLTHNWIKEGSWANGDDSTVLIPHPKNKELTEIFKQITEDEDI